MDGRTHIVIIVQIQGSCNIEYHFASARTCIKPLVLLYADDTVIFCTDEKLTFSIYSSGISPECQIVEIRISLISVFIIHNQTVY